MEVLDGQTPSPPPPSFQVAQTQPPSPNVSQLNVPPPTSPPPTPQDYVIHAPTLEYASFWRRFFAHSLDGVIVGVVYATIGAIFGLAMGVSSVGVGEEGASSLALFGSLFSTAINLIIAFVYYIYFIGSRGQTPGKMALGIKVVKIKESTAPGYMSAFLRETVGKLISSVVLLLGYFWMLWDSQKQTWHDKIAGTIVVKA